MKGDFLDKGELVFWRAPIKFSKSTTLSAMPRLVFDTGVAGSLFDTMLAARPSCTGVAGWDKVPVGTELLEANCSIECGVNESGEDAGVFNNASRLSSSSDLSRSAVMSSSSSSESYPPLPPECIYFKQLIL
ncbi:unnamed protein product [Meganyctiphanes norvegica]|uniref:Uncharacterized protein n=1 Tax=Meganyctiphanes norvegica TaxID=48144 RepID=A0AAV2QU94_MEGNR